jgi:peptidoglycan hydrolase CwlO-like protein
MFYVILTIVILVVFGTILASPKQSKDQQGGNQVEAIQSSIEALNDLRTKIEQLKSTIQNIAPELPSQGNAIQEITTTLNEFQKNFFNTLDNMASNVETQLS